jgi:hypothetical protein
MWTSADLIAACLLCKGGQELNNSAATQHPIPTHILSTEGMRFTSFLLHNLQIASAPCISVPYTRINMTCKKEDSCRWRSERRSEWGGNLRPRCWPRTLLSTTTSSMCPTCNSIVVCTCCTQSGLAEEATLKLTDLLRQ